MIFEVDSQISSLQTFNTRWQRGLNDPNTKQYSVALKNYYNELSSEIIDPTLKIQKFESETRFGAERWITTTSG